MSLEILSTVWGRQYLETFKKTAIESLSWDKNKEALIKEGTTWNIYTDKEFIPEITALCHELNHEIKYNIQSRETLRDYIDENQSATIWQMRRSIDTGCKVLLAPPDTLFGDGTIAGLLSAAEDPGSVVVVPHPRVLPSILEEIEPMPLPIDNAPLVGIAWRHLHEAWIHAEVGCKDQSSYIGGIWWKKVNGLITGKHLLPSPYMIHFLEQDMEYFDKACSFGHFDWRWPGDILVPQGRQRYIASSDLAFIVEITDPNKNVPQIYENQPATGFHRDDPHNRANAQIMFTFRGAS